MGYSVVQGLGFFIQLTPPFLLMLIPFSDDVFRYRKSRMALGMLIYLAAASVLFSIIAALSLRFTPGLAPLIENFYILIIILAAIWAFCMITQTSGEKRVTIIFLVFLYATSQFIIVNLFIQGGAMLAPGQFYSLPVLALYLVTTLLMFPASAVGMYRVIRVYLDEIDPRNIRTELRLTIIISGVFEILMFIYTNGSTIFHMQYWWVVLPLALFTVVVLCIFYWYIFRESVQRERESEYQKLSEVQRIQYSNIVNEMENSRRMRHDMRHYLQGLYSLLKDNDLDGMEDYLMDLLKQVEQNKAEVYCANQSVNGLLQYYADMAADENIKMDVEAECGEDISIHPTDLTVVLGNTLENAIRSCKQTEEGKEREISIQIGMVGESLMICVENSCESVHCSEHYRAEDGFLPATAFISTRQDGGYGLESITLAARRYGGEAGFKFDDRTRTFTTRVRMNLHPEDL